MAEYINLDDMLEQFDKRASKLVGDRRVSVETMREFICNRPKANVKEIVCAHWIEKKSTMGRYFECSNCGAHENKHTAIKGYYCWRCGAEMDKRNEPKN